MRKEKNVRLKFKLGHNKNMTLKDLLFHWNYLLMNINLIKKKSIILCQKVIDLPFNSLVNPKIFNLINKILIIQIKIWKLIMNYKKRWLKNKIKSIWIQKGKKEKALTLYIINNRLKTKIKSTKSSNFRNFKSLINEF